MLGKNMTRKRKLLAFMKYADRSGRAIANAMKAYRNPESFSYGDRVVFTYKDYDQVMKLGYGFFTKAINIGEMNLSSALPVAKSPSGKIYKIVIGKDASGRKFLYGQYAPGLKEVKSFDAGTYYFPITFSPMIVTFAKKSGMNLEGVSFIKASVSPPNNFTKEGMIFYYPDGKSIDVEKILKEDGNEEVKMVFDGIVEKGYVDLAIRLSLLTGDGDYTTKEGAADAIRNGDRHVVVTLDGTSIGKPKISNK
jgi:uncharacterized protein (UPF0297 family)